MFNVDRNIPAPACLSRKIYNHKDVTDALDGLFYGKCYLCEQGDLSDPEIEHFIPHEDDDLLKYKWENLFLSCSRCNSIKSNTHKDLLDCTSNNVSVFDEIIYLAGNAANGKIEIKARRNRPSKQVINTVALLNKCFNSSSTGLRGITKENLMEKLNEEYYYFMGCRMQLVGKRSTVEEVQQAKNKLKPMCKTSYPFSVFWKWHLLTDLRVMKRFPQIRKELGF